MENVQNAGTPQDLSLSKKDGVSSVISPQNNPISNFEQAIEWAYQSKVMTDMKAMTQYSVAVWTIKRRKKYSEAGNEKARLRWLRKSLANGKSFWKYGGSVSTSVNAARRN